MHDRATWHNFSIGATQQTGNPLDVSIDGDAFLVVQTPRGERYTRNGALQINATGQLVTASGDRVLGDGGPIQFQQTDSNISINPDGTITVREGRQRRLRLGARQAAAGALRADVQTLLKDGASMFRAPDGTAPQPADTNVRVVQGAIEQSNVRPVIEMARMIELTRTYTQIAEHVAAGGRASPQRHRQARRSTGLSERRHPCAHFIPQRPE